MLREKTLYGEIDKVSIAVARLREFEKSALEYDSGGYYVCISGGKDSSVIQQLCLLAGVKCTFHHNLTTVDDKRTVHFVLSEKRRLERMGKTFEIDIARDAEGKPKTMWNLIPKKGFPTRYARWCCEQLKERYGKEKVCVTGVRWAESPRRKADHALYELTKRVKERRINLNNDNDAKRKLVEMCSTKRKVVINPIVDWSDEDVWEFLKEQAVPVNPLYLQGCTRVGCIGCPIVKYKDRYLDKTPDIKARYIKAGGEWLARQRARGIEIPEEISTPEKYFLHWRSDSNIEETLNLNYEG
jgi:phosphoadenosine phosphosulfate reductase